MARQAKYFFGLWRNHLACKTSRRSSYRFLVSFVQSCLYTFSFPSNVAYSYVHTFAQIYDHAAAIDLNRLNTRTFAWPRLIQD